MSGYDAANETFAVTDLLAGQPMLRRSLSDPSASVDQRLGLARKLFGERVGAQTMGAVESVVQASWRKPEAMVQGLELEGVRLALLDAQAQGSLDQVTQELHSIGTAVGESSELTSTLRSAAYDLDAKRGLIARLLGPEAHPVTSLLSARAVAGHKRSFSKTVDAYLDMAAELASVVVAKVTVARPLDEGRMQRMRQALSARAGRPVALQVDVDPEVIGGVNVSIGHEVYESTVAGRLEDVRRQLINS